MNPIKKVYKLEKKIATAIKRNHYKAIIKPRVDDYINTVKKRDSLKCGGLEELMENLIDIYPELINHRKYLLDKETGKNTSNYKATKDFNQRFLNTSLEGAIESYCQNSCKARDKCEICDDILNYFERSYDSKNGKKHIKSIPQHPEKSPKSKSENNSQCNQVSLLMKSQIPALKEAFSHRKKLIIKESHFTPSEMETELKFLKTSMGAWGEGYKLMFCKLACPDKKECVLEYNGLHQYTNYYKKKHKKATKKIRQQIYSIGPKINNFIKHKIKKKDST